jgi:hypothetical protein
MNSPNRAGMALKNTQFFGENQHVPGKFTPTNRLLANNLLLLSLLYSKIIQ